MRRLTIAILALLTAFSAMTSGALNGRVLCMAGSEHLAIEDPHATALGGERHCGIERCAEHPSASATDRAAELNGGGDRDADGCVDVEANGTLVHESATPTFDNAHALLPIGQLLTSSASPAALLALGCQPARAEAAGDCPPSPTELVGLRVIVLLT